MNDSLIEWTSKTWNPVTGCPGPKVSSGCANCYAERTAKTRLAGRYGYDVDDPFGIHVHDERWLQPLRAKKPQRIFVCSMGDLFHKSVSLQYVAKVFAVMAMCPQHTFILLTKRADRMEKFVSDTSTLANDRRGVAYQEIALAAGRDCNMDGLPWPLPNVWLGVTVCTPDELRPRITSLLRTPAAKRVVSVEPMLAALDFCHIPVACVAEGEYLDALRGVEFLGDGAFNVPKIDWIICGGETGPNARPMNYAWAYKLAEQCWSAGTPFFFKSWGEWTPAFYQPDGGYKVNPDADIPHGFKAAYHVFPENPGIRMYKVGKKHSGRSLDERGEWNEVPA